MTHSYVRHDAFVSETWRICMWDVPHSYVRHDSFICETWRICMWDMTHPYVGRASFICVTWLIHMCDMTHAYAWHHSCMRINEGSNCHAYGTGPSSMSHMCIWYIWIHLQDIRIYQHIRLETNIFNIYTWIRMSGYSYPTTSTHIYEFLQHIHIDTNVKIFVHLSTYTYLIICKKIACVCGIQMSARWLMDVCNMTHACMQHASSMSAKMTYSCVFITRWWVWMNHCGYGFRDYGVATVSRID